MFMFLKFTFLLCLCFYGFGMLHPVAPTTEEQILHLINAKRLSLDNTNERGVSDIKYI
jgi:hypothetical protein